MAEEQRLQSDDFVVFLEHNPTEEQKYDGGLFLHNIHDKRDEHPKA